MRTVAYPFFDTCVKQVALKHLTLTYPSLQFVVEISRETGVPESSLCQSLKSLYDYGLLQKNKAGKNVYYRLQPIYINAFRDVFAALEKIKKLSEGEE